MDGYDARPYGQRWAPYYDDLHPEADDSVIQLLADYAGTSSRAFELAIGSGRIAIPLACSGVELIGTDEMVAMGTKPGGEAIDVSILPVESQFAWPSELDLMARMAGLELEDRFGWYDRRDYSAELTNHVSIYRKPG